jgi:hypothetical protein
VEYFESGQPVKYFVAPLRQNHTLFGTVPTGEPRFLGHRHEFSTMPGAFILRSSADSRGTASRTIQCRHVVTQR